MSKKRFWTALVCAAGMALSLCAPASADSSKVVTLGANLTQEQKDMMMRYFNASYDQVQIITVDNDDERERLSAYVPLEQIGTRTYSCAYVQPTESGGIRVKTANLSWVTCNMIATTLSTSGVTNCDVVAASPFLVSGTGALTGIIMAYETATGEELSQEKKDLATEEMVVTGELGDRIGQTDATAIVNEAKMDVLEEGLLDQEVISETVQQAALDKGYELTDEEVEVISGLMEKISQQDYDYESMRGTLEMVAENVSDTDLGLEVVEEESELIPETTEQTEGLDETGDLEVIGDSILDLVDDSALGEDILTGTTDEKETEPPVEEIPQETEAAFWEETEMGTEAPALVEVIETEAPTTEAPAELPETEWMTEAWETEPMTEALETETEALSPDDLSEEDRADYDDLVKFCEDFFSDSEWMEDGTEKPAVDPETAKEAIDYVEKLFLSVKLEGLGDYLPEEGALYLSDELNYLDEALQEYFLEDEEGIFDLYSEEVCQTLYDEVMWFFAEMYEELPEILEEETGGLEEIGLEEGGFLEEGDLGLEEVESLEIVE